MFSVSGEREFHSIGRDVPWPGDPIEDGISYAVDWETSWSLWGTHGGSVGDEQVTDDQDQAGGHAGMVGQ